MNLDIAEIILLLILISFLSGVFTGFMLKRFIDFIIEKIIEQ